MRTCTWAGRDAKTGKLAKDVLMMSLTLLMQLFKERATKVEYIRTLSIALMSWTDWMGELPACCFNEESCEALLSRMAAVCRSHHTLSSFGNICDLFITLPPPSRQLKATRGKLREGLLHLFAVRCRRIIAQGELNPYIEWGQRAKFQESMPDNFNFPMEITDVNVGTVRDVFENSLRCLRSPSKQSPEVDAFFKAHLPLASPDDWEPLPKMPVKRNRRDSRLDQATSSNGLQNASATQIEESESSSSLTSDSSSEGTESELGSLLDVIDVDALSEISVPVQFMEEDVGVEIDD